MSISHILFDTEPPNGVAGQFLTCGGPMATPGYINNGPSAYWSNGPVVPAGLVSPNLVQYAQVGAGPATVAAGQPITFGSTPVGSSNTNFVLTTSIQAPFSASGSVITVVKAGTYLMSYQMNPQANGGADIYYGATLAAILPLAYTMSGSQTATDVIGGSFLVVCAAGSSIALCAAAGNSAPLDPYANSSTTNASSTSLSIVQVA